MKLIVGMFHANAISLLAVAYIAYNTENGMLLAAILFSLAIVTESALIFFLDEADLTTSWEKYILKVKRKIARVKSKQRKKRKEQYLCSKCKATTPVMK